MKIRHRHRNEIVFEDDSGTMRETILRAIKNGVDLRGAHLSDADLSGVDLRGAYLSGAYLRGADLRGADLRGEDLSDADLSGAYLRGADLSGAYLSGAYLSGANIPTVENIDAKILAEIEAGGKLDMRLWHTCETTHCRAGWAIALAGKPGKELEEKVGSNAAGALIYAASRPGLPVPNFFATDEEAMADIRKCAGAA
jgi:uncharacterized protein YjbI with pentapeptide repeats